MKRKFYLILLFLLFVVKVNALPLPVEVTADGVILMNADTGEVIYEKNPDKKEILASLTKMMTIYTALDYQDNLNKKVTITQKDIAGLWEYTKVGLEEGEKVTYTDLLYGAMLRSGADAALALANHIGGSEEKFVKLMNAEAEKMGLRNTHYADSYGGSDDNVSTPREQALFVREAVKNKTFKKIFGAKEYTLSNGIKVVNNTRNLARFYAYDPNIITGDKPGYTTPAGLLLASTATINGVNYILVVCKSDINEIFSQHVIDSYKIYHYIIEHTSKEQVIIPKDSVLTTIPVVDGTTSEYAVIADEDIKLKLTTEEFDRITYDYNVASYITPYNKVGDNLGYIDILIDGEVVSTYNIFLKDKIFSYQEQSKKIIVIIVLLGFVVIVLLCVNIFARTKK